MQEKDWLQHWRGGFNNWSHTSRRSQPPMWATPAKTHTHTKNRDLKALASNECTQQGRVHVKGVHATHFLKLHWGRQLWICEGCGGQLSTLQPRAACPKGSVTSATPSLRANCTRALSLIRRSLPPNIKLLGAGNQKPRKEWSFWRQSVKMQP